MTGKTKQAGAIGMKNIRGYFYAAVAFAVAAFGIWAFTPDKVGYSLSAEVNAGSMQDTFIGTEITYDAAHPEDYFIGQAVQGDGGWYIYGGSVGKGYSVLNPIGEKVGADAIIIFGKKMTTGKPGTVFGGGMNFIAMRRSAWSLYGRHLLQVVFGLREKLPMYSWERAVSVTR